MNRVDPLTFLRFQVDRHGWLAVAGLLLLIAAVGTQLVAVDGLRAQAAELRMGQLALRQRLAQQPVAQETAGGRLAAFEASLPGAPGALAAIDTIHRSAAAHGVALSAGEYRLAQEAKAPWQRYQITLPARASYPKLREWLGDVMNAVPAAALDEISLRRDDAGSALVDARVRMTLFLRAP